MATCPQCGGFLSGHHRCFSIWRNRARIGSVAVVGALLGIVVATLLAASHPLPVTGVAALLGAVMATTVWQELH